jgi:hypothetical protein
VAVGCDFMMGKYGSTFPLCFMFTNGYSMVLLIEVKRSLFLVESFSVNLLNNQLEINRLTR